jgi:hypothetical protein
LANWYNICYWHNIIISPNNKVSLSKKKKRKKVQDVQPSVFLKAHLASSIAQTFENRGVQSAGEFG